MKTAVLLIQVPDNQTIRDYLVDNIYHRLGDDEERHDCYIRFAPMPHELAETDLGKYSRDYINGWNACISEIIGNQAQPIIKVGRD